MSEWIEIPLGRLAKKITKGTTPPKGKGFVNVGGINYIKSDAISYDGTIDVSKFSQIDTMTHNKFLRSQLHVDDILFSMAGIYLGKNGLVTESMLPANTNQALAIIRLDKEKCFPKFLSYFLRQETIIEYVNNMSGQSAQPNINFSDIASINITLPPLTEQKAIAGVLSSLDDKIDLLHRQNKILEAMAETLFRQWFIEEAEDNWDEGILTDQFTLIMGQSPASTSFNEEGIGLPMFQGNADFGFRFPRNRVFTTAPTRIAEKFDTLVSVRAPVGAQNMASEKCCLGRGVAAFRFKADTTYYTYTYYKLMSHMDEIKLFNDEGTVFGSIGKKDFETIETTIPPMEYIKRFENECRPLNDRIINNCCQINKIEAIRDTLLPKLMSGEVRVEP